MCLEMWNYHNNSNHGRKPFNNPLQLFFMSWTIVCGLIALGLFELNAILPRNPSVSK